jgi:hypothetical protein
LNGPSSAIDIIVAHARKTPVVTLKEEVVRRSLALIALFLSACGNEPDAVPVLGEAFIAPPSLELRREIDPRAPAVASVKHGERVEIVQRRRSFFRVRTASGATGWTDQRSLLNGKEMAALERVEEMARKLPAQATATTFDLLNAHLEPYRQSPTIFQLKEGDKVEVLAYDVLPRVAPEREPLIPPPPKPQPVARKKKAEPKFPPPPKPQPPPPPQDWLELSKTPALPEDTETDRDKPQNAPPPAPLDDWALVRRTDGQAGWVLTNRLYMAIPDEVAQYAEGRRITSYFPLGEVKDGETIKRHWLWTTLDQRHQAHDFDSFRVFIWSLRRHRYETAYIERNRTGHFPVMVKGPQFSLCLEKDGGRFRRTYELQGNIVRFLGEAPCETPVLESFRDAVQVAAGTASEEPQAQKSVSLVDRIKGLFR